MLLRIFVASFGVLLACVASAEDWKNEKPCATPKIPFKQTDTPKCVQSYCAAATQLGKLCVCVPEDAEQNALVMIRRGDREESWPVEVIPAGLDPSFFELRPLARSGPAAETWLFAMLTSQSNGMGVQRWEVRLISPQRTSQARTAIDFGALSQLTQPAQGGACRLLSGQWVNGWDRKRGGGLYFVAEWFEALDGEWQSAKDMPVLHRRYLNNFAVARGKVLGPPTGPLRWYNHVDTRIGPAPLQPQK